MTEPQEEAGWEPTIRRLILFVCVYAIVVVWVMRPVVDHDIWWHLAAGKWIVENRTVTTTDPFSAFGKDRPWVAYSWLFEVLVYGLYQLAGLYGIIFYRLAMSLAVVGSMHHFLAKREPRFLVVIGLLVLGVLADIPIFNERPWLFTVVFTTWTLEAVRNLRDGKSTWMVWLLPLVYVIWANIHIQFVYGLFILGLGWFATVAEYVRQRLATPEETAPPPWPAAATKMLLLGLLCTLVTLLPPYSWKLWVVIVEYATQPAAFLVVDELTPPTFRYASDWVMLGSIMLAVFSLGQRRERITLFNVLLLIAGVIFAFRAKRDVWLVVLAVYNVWTTAVPLPKSADQLFRFTWPRIAMLLAALVPVTVAAGIARNLSSAELQKAIAKDFPVEAVQFVKDKGYEGPMFNHFGWGGFLIWRLPEIPVQMDGRTNLHTDDRIRQTVATWSGHSSWADDPELEAANLVIAPKDQGLTALLRVDPRYRIVYEDSMAVVFVREGPLLPRGRP